ncbi:MAG TPA: Rieske (2Fe-2S) protein [Blastocatellia bacterium]|nr:Rieske (2Fe-2S) protein [Blastocatellia bacterium]
MKNAETEKEDRAARSESKGEDSHTLTAPGRRSFLGVIAGLIGGAITAVLAVTTGRFAAGPSQEGGENSQWTQAALLEEVPETQWTKRNVTVSQDAGWGRFNTQRPVWVFKQNGKVTVFSATCPHLGCTINEGQNGFVCPCHGSSWNAEGAKLGGPTPRNMDSLESRVNGDALEVKYEYFKQGVPEKIPVG